uniref:UDP-3-O-[3-hydroxymyristoyl] glucosamine N-acyltransferase n=1 Tax=Magnetococcus massalia (strain MO-1) TaxID=451514 RepID=A0A1S7LCH1_MAGMO|nr:UDP-3-O-[3-hydroxymyristoyl] glucosamine N-acyltransferase [Candidatus Magnetococcus massalia]
MKLSQLATSLDLPHHGKDVTLKGVAPVESAGDGMLTFVQSANWLKRVEGAAAVIIPQELAETPPDIPCLISPAPVLSAADAGKILGMSSHPGPAPGIHPSAVIDPSAELGARVAIGPGVVVEADVVIGEGCQIHPNVVIHQGSRLGCGCIIHANAVIGAEGFGFEFVGGKHARITHFGGVAIGDDVEVGAGTTIDRARFGMTTIGEGSRIDNQVQVGHNVQIGKHCVIVSQVGIAGSCVVEDYAILAGQAGLAPHVTIGQGARIGASTGIAGGSVPAGETWSGWWGQPHRESMSQLSAMRKLPAFMKQVRAFMKKMEKSE